MIIVLFELEESKESSLFSMLIVYRVLSDKQCYPFSIYRIIALLLFGGQ